MDNIRNKTNGSLTHRRSALCAASPGEGPTDLYLYMLSKPYDDDEHLSGNFCHMLITFANSFGPDSGPTSKFREFISILSLNI